jgi:hypothetical protein
VPEEKYAYRIDELGDVLPLGRTKAWEEIAAGRLKARKIGRRTVVLAKDLRDYLASLPEAR